VCVCVYPYCIVIVCCRSNAIQLSLCGGWLSPVWAFLSKWYFLVGNNTKADSWLYCDTSSWDVTSKISEQAATKSPSWW